MYLRRTADAPYGIDVPGMGNYMQDGYLEDFKTARKFLEKLANPRRTPKPNEDFRNQANLLLGELWEAAYQKNHKALSGSERCDPRQMAVKHYQQVNLGEIPATADIWMVMSARNKIAALYQHAKFPDNERKIKLPGKFKADHLRTLVANIEIFRIASTHQQAPAAAPDQSLRIDFNSIQETLEPFIDTQHLREKHLVFRNQGLDYSQQYKILRACFDRQLIDAQNFQLNLMRIHAGIKDSHLDRDTKLRRNVKYYLTDVLLQRYYSPETSQADKTACINNLAQLYNDLQEPNKQANFNLALAANKPKARDARHLLNRLKWQGHQHLPLTKFGAHIAEVTGPVIEVSKLIFSIPLTIIGSVLDIITIIPLVLKALSALPLCCGSTDLGRGMWGQNIDNPWTDTCFTFLFKQLGKLIGLIVGGVIGLVTSLVSYLPRLVVQGIRNVRRDAPAANELVNGNQIKDALSDKPMRFKNKKPALDYLRKEKRYNNYHDEGGEAKTKYENRFKLFHPRVIDPDAPSAPHYNQLDYQEYEQEVPMNLGLYDIPPAVYGN